ncbi:hypothetical protein C8Q80DRAFT_560319 [Daedaleopsis nitida]|nr:hypothetical protein C8Q80DRAFT_560319 [Daedaleopsis nitida]
MDRCIRMGEGGAASTCCLYARPHCAAVACFPRGGWSDPASFVPDSNLHRRHHSPSLAPSLAITSLKATFLFLLARTYTTSHPLLNSASFCMRIFVTFAQTLSKNVFHPRTRDRYYTDPPHYIASFADCCAEYRTPIASSLHLYISVYRILPPSHPYNRTLAYTLRIPPRPKSFSPIHSSQWPHARTCLSGPPGPQASCLMSISMTPSVPRSFHCIERQPCGRGLNCESRIGSLSGTSAPIQRFPGRF